MADVQLKARRLDRIASWINQHSATLRMVATVEPTSVSTDRKPRGFRYITKPGKGRSGLLFRAYGADANGERLRDKITGSSLPFFEHNSAETYAVNLTVERWLAKYILGLDAAHRRKLGVPAKTLNYWVRT